MNHPDDHQPVSWPDLSGFGARLAVAQTDAGRRLVLVVVDVDLFLQSVAPDMVSEKLDFLGSDLRAVFPGFSSEHVKKIPKNSINDPEPESGSSLPTP